MADWTGQGGEGMEQGRSTAAATGPVRACWRRYGPAAIVAAAAVSLVLGLLLPSLEFHRFFLLPERHSLLGVVVALLEEREYFLGLVLGAFSIVFPALKLVVLARLAAGRIAGRGMPATAVRLAALFGRWSMLDVLVIALVVFAVKRSGLADATALPGIWFFALAAILSIVAARLLETRGRAAI
ncbi:paraquat-inducible protein A [Microbaculum marinum]|uniref:Paraquat-inducible protein A n=1 Tax=Microbaculum marinum TaxID=1764581 RepID=A0AAW9RZC8_9HYPH